jgi:hypothetical protein
MKQKFAVAVMCLAVLFLVGSCVRWKWNECRQVGHGVMYCAFVEMARK